jgi:hypothetical protein
VISTDCCRKGHPYTPENTRIVAVKGLEQRQCRECDKQRAQAKRDRLRGERPKFRRKLQERCLNGHELSGDNLYYYETKNHGRQRRCRVCQTLREQGYIDRQETVQPKKEFCINGHRLEGDNLSFAPNGYAVCRKCRLESAQRWQADNREKHLESKQRVHEKDRRTRAAALKAALIALSERRLEPDSKMAELLTIWESFRITGGRSLYRRPQNSFTF